MKQTRMQIAVALIGALLVLPVTAFAQENAAVALRAAKETETVEGDLDSAIEQYERLSEGSDRAIAAQALVRMAGCYEKLGTVQAQVIYERVLRDFADQRESANLARTKLAALSLDATSTAAMSTRKVWEKPLIIGTVSPDGRYVSTTDWTEGGDLAIRDLVAGVDRRLTEREDATGSYADGSVISPDGKRVAYLWAKIPPGKSEKWEFQARIVPIENKSTPQIVHRSPNYFFVSAWMPDGKGLVLTRAVEDESWQIVILSLEDGSLRQLRSLKWGKIGISVSPDGRHLAYDVPTGDGPARDIFVLATDGSQEQVLVQHPANDTSTVWTPDGSRILFVSDRTATPSLWSIPVKDGRAIGEAELVRANTGAIQPKGITPSGALYYKIEARSFRNVYRAMLGEDGKVIGTPQVVGEQFVNANWGASLSPDGSEIAFYSFRPRQSLVIRNVKTGKERVFPIDMGVISGPYFDGPQWFADGRSALVKVSQQQHPGDIIIRIDTATGKVDPYPIDNGALYRTSRDGKHIFYRGTGGTGLVAFNLETRLKTVLLPTESGTDDRIGSIAVSPDGKEVAYRTQAEDAHVFKILPVSGGEPREVFRYPAGGGLERFNALSWTPDQRHLLFVKEKERESDSRCSGDSPTCVHSIFRIDIARGEAERLGGDLRVNMKNPQLHPDGRSIYFSGMGVDDELWVLENFLPTQTASK